MAVNKNKRRPKYDEYKKFIDIEFFIIAVTMILSGIALVCIFFSWMLDKKNGSFVGFCASFVWIALGIIIYRLSLEEYRRMRHFFKQEALKEKRKREELEEQREQEMEEAKKLEQALCSFDKQLDIPNISHKEAPRQQEHVVEMAKTKIIDNDMFSVNCDAKLLPKIKQKNNGKPMIDTQELLKDLAPWQDVKMNNYHKKQHTYYRRNNQQNRQKRNRRQK